MPTGPFKRTGSLRAERSPVVTSTSQSAGRAATLTKSGRPKHRSRSATRPMSIPMMDDLLPPVSTSTPRRDGFRHPSEAWNATTTIPNVRPFSYHNETTEFLSLSPGDLHSSTDPRFRSEEHFGHHRHPNSWFGPQSYPAPPYEDRYTHYTPPRETNYYQPQQNGPYPYHPSEYSTYPGPQASAYPYSPAGKRYYPDPVSELLYAGYPEDLMYPSHHQNYGRNDPMVNGAYEPSRLDSNNNGINHHHPQEDLYASIPRSSSQKAGSSTPSSRNDLPRTSSVRSSRSRGSVSPVRNYNDVQRNSSTRSSRSKGSLSPKTSDSYPGLQIYEKYPPASTSTSTSSRSKSSPKRSFSKSSPELNSRRKSSEPSTSGGKSSKSSSRSKSSQPRSSSGTSWPNTEPSKSPSRNRRSQERQINQHSNGGVSQTAYPHSRESPESPYEYHTYPKHQKPVQNGANNSNNTLRSSPQASNNNTDDSYMSFKQGIDTHPSLKRESSRRVSPKRYPSYTSPEAKFLHKGKIVDESLVEEILNQWGADGTLRRKHSSSYHWRIFPHYTDLVMIPFKGRDRSVIRIERLGQKDVNYKAAHFVAEGPFKGIVINNAVTELRVVGQADLTLSFDVSMTNVKRRVNPEYKERRKVHFWFKQDADNTEMGREYMRQLLKPEGFPRDYVSFIKKALVLTQRFPLIQRIDIVLIPRYRFDEPDSGYVNGENMTSPTHEDWLKTTEEEEAARLKAQKEAQAKAERDAAKWRKLKEQEEEKKRQEELERKRREELERKKRKEAEERRRREEEERRRREEEERRRREEEERRRREEEERRRREEEERRRREEEERKRKEEEERRRREEEEQKIHVETLTNINLKQPTEEDMEEAIQNFITVMTPAVYDYQYLPEVPVSNKSCVNFRLKAKSSAHVALSSVYGDTERKTYEIVIGDRDNTKSAIRYGGEGPVVMEAVTLNILDEDGFRPFWISWDDGRIVVGEGTQKGEDPFLIWDVPQNRVHSINCMAVSTAPGSEGQWEFIEYIYPRRPEDETRDARRQRFRSSLMWLAKKQKMLQVLEDAYPNSVNTPDLLRICNIGLHDMMTAVVILKEFEKRGLITEVVKGVWIRSPSNLPGDQHVVKVVDHLPVLKGRDIPTIAIVTSLYCEKLAVDAMMEDKVSYVKYRTEVKISEYRESHVYTIGRIGNQMCVSTKLSRVGAGRGATIAAGNTVTRLLGIFDRVDHVILVGSAGAVPDYHDYKRHARLGDIVVGCPRQRDGPSYIHCEKFQQQDNGKYEYDTRTFTAKDDTLQTSVDQIKQLSESSSFGRMTPWEKFIEQGLKALNAEESNFSKPSLKKDKLYAWVDEERVQVEHPKPPRGQEYMYKEGVTHVRFGPIGSGKYVSRNEKIRYDFARKWGIMAYDSEIGACLDAILGSRKDSFIVIRGIADYQDGTKSKEWQPYASLVAAAFMKALVTAMPTSYRRSGYYR